MNGRQWKRARLGHMDVRIRKAELDDAPAIGLVHVKSWRQTYPRIIPDAYLAALDSEERASMWKQALAAARVLVFVAEDRGGIVGFIAGGAIREPIEGYDAELYALYLTPERQRQGLGLELATTLRERLQQQGFSSMMVWVLEENLGGVSFYKRMGGLKIEQRTIDIGGKALAELAFGWSEL